MLIGFVMLMGSVGTVKAAPPNPAMTGTSKIQENQAGYLENILFEKFRGKERVVLMLSRQSGALAEDQPGNIVLIKMDNLFVPQTLRRPMGEGALDNLIRVVPVQKVNDNSQQAIIRIELNKLVPYRIGQDGHNIVIDFNVASLPEKAIASGEKLAVKEQQSTESIIVVDQKTQKLPALRDGSREKSAIVKPSYATRPIYLDVQDASIKSILQLLAEEGGVNIVYGDDVKGNVTINLKNIPWGQALDTILAINDMTKIQEGDIITVMTTKRLREIQNEAEAAEKRQRAATEEREKQEQQKKADSGKLRQISIEAKIVEASSSFVRQLGVQWGGGHQDAWSPGSNWNYGVLAGTGNNPLGVFTSLPTGVGLTGSNLAVNFPSGLLGIPSIGLVLGSGTSVISAQLQALETTSEGKLISTPRVIIMEGEKAIIKQGEEIPVVTPASATNPASTTYKPAELKLEVTPKITEDGRISMTISASNNRAEKDQKDPATGNMPVATNAIDSKVVVKDGDTIVIGGIIRSEDTISDSGFPWISKIPILGWLFNTNIINKTKRELLIFVTPRIFKTETPVALKDKG
ncbi:MAG: secretin and TonB N-terminal domain-containing protein [Deltaproteobacteria bacterium]|nr:secretin and TonB N-terminal domain-containing protein [Deltaproteobacteria bacterium]